MSSDEEVWDDKIVIDKVETYERVVLSVDGKFSIKDKIKYKLKEWKKRIKRMVDNNE